MSKRNGKVSVVEAIFLLPKNPGLLRAGHLLLEPWGLERWALLCPAGWPHNPKMRSLLELLVYSECV